MAVIVLRIFSIFIIAFMGFAACKLKWIDGEGSKALSSVMMNISSPCLVLYSVTEQELNGDTWTAIKCCILFALVYYIMGSVVNFPISKGLTPLRETQGIYWSQLTFTNNGFLGFPIALAVFGDKGLFYMAMINMVTCFFMYTLGIAEVKYGGEEQKETGGLKNMLKEMLSVPTIACILAFLMLVLHLKFPDFLADSINTVGSMTVPLSMLIIGIQLGESDFFAVLKNKRNLIFCCIKLVFWPALVFLIASRFHMEGLLVAIMVLTVCMPAAALPVVFAEKYNRDAKLCAELTFISTLFSMITIPATCILLSYYLI